MTAQESAARALPGFSLAGVDGAVRRFPSGRLALLCFVKEDCPTCVVSMPVIERFHGAFGGVVDVWAIGQESEGNRELVERQGLRVPMLDDDALRVSHAYRLETVPTVILADPEGRELRRFEGFVREDWRGLVSELAARTGGEPPAVPWEELPEWRPGCGSRSVEPGIAERLVAEEQGSPLRARVLDVAPEDDVEELMFELGFSDGLPVVPPTPERVLRMLSGTLRDAQEVVAVVPPNMGRATVEKVAINAVMAGCRPEYLPVVIAALEAACTDRFNIHGLLVTTMGATPVMVVNGPIRERLAMNSGIGALGQGNRANATIGRALRLVLRNVGGARPGETERSTLASPAKFTLCFAEWEERSPWEPLHVERGFEAAADVVTLFGLTGGPFQIVDQTSRSARALGTSIARALEHVWNTRVQVGDVLLVVSPEHVDTLARDGWSKADLRRHIQEVTARPLRDRLADPEAGDGIGAASFGPDGPPAERLDEPWSKFKSPENIHIVVAGGETGKFSAAFAGWTSGPAGTSPVSRQIDEEEQP